MRFRCHIGNSAVGKACRCGPAGPSRACGRTKAKSGYRYRSARDFLWPMAGESDAGKNVVARAPYWHRMGAASPLVAIDAAAIAKNLLESEMPGDERSPFNSPGYRAVDFAPRKPPHELPIATRTSAVVRWNLVTFRQALWYGCNFRRWPPQRSTSSDLCAPMLPLDVDTPSLQARPAPHFPARTAHTR